MPAVCGSFLLWVLVDDASVRPRHARTLRCCSAAAPPLLFAICTRRIVWGAVSGCGAGAWGTGTRSSLSGVVAGSAAADDDSARLRPHPRNARPADNQSIHTLVIVIVWRWIEGRAPVQHRQSTRQGALQQLNPSRARRVGQQQQREGSPRATPHGLSIERARSGGRLSLEHLRSPSAICVLPLLAPAIHEATTRLTWTPCTSPTPPLPHDRTVPSPSILLSRRRTSQPLPSYESSRPRACAPASAWYVRRGEGGDGGLDRMLHRGKSRVGCPTWGRALDRSSASSCHRSIELET